MGSGTYDMVGLKAGIQIIGSLFQPWLPLDGGQDAEDGAIKEQVLRVLRGKPANSHHETSVSGWEESAGSVSYQGRNQCSPGAQFAQGNQSCSIDQVLLVMRASSHSERDSSTSIC